MGAVSKETSITFIGTEWLQQFDQIKLALPKPTKNKSPQKSGQTKQPTTHNLATTKSTTTAAAAATTTSFLTATKREVGEKKEGKEERKKKPKKKKKKSIVLECCSPKY